jgi:hypothetical protein
MGGQNFDYLMYLKRAKADVDAAETERQSI